MASNRIERIKEKLQELDGLFWEIDHISDWDNIKGKYEHQLKQRYIEARESFQYLAKQVVILCNTHLESEGLTNLLNDFKLEIKPFLADTKSKLYESVFDKENALAESVFINTITLYMGGIKGFYNDSNDLLTHRVGIQYLENILKNTSVILNSLGKVPKKEVDIYKEVKFVLQSVFFDYHKSTFAFTKPSKNYKPDILIPQLNTAIEYKYSKNEEGLSECIEQIRTDVYGYSEHPTFKLFYAVFYLKESFCTIERAYEIWSDHDFPKNWKPIFVVGK